MGGLDKLFEQFPKIIAEAAKTRQGIVALVVLALSIIGFLFFQGADIWVKVAMFVLIFGGFVFFVLVVFSRYPETQQPQREEMKQGGPNVAERLDTSVPLVAPSLPSTGSILLGKYEVIRDLYDEALSRLQEVKNRYDGSVYLLKTIKNKSTYNPDVISIIRKAYEGTAVESRVAVPIEIREDGEYFYEILPYFKGFTLFELVTENKIGIRGALLELWAKDLLELVKPSHEFRPTIVHRDISPYNLLVTSEGLHLTLLDFSSAVSLEVGKSYQVIGCPGFTAPEQREAKYSTRSDIYSVGALLYYLNSGVVPPTVDDRRYRGTEITLEEPIRGRLAAAIYKMYALEPSERFQDANEALNYIDRHTSTEVLSLEPIGTLQLPGGGQIVMSRHDWNWHK